MLDLMIPKTDLPKLNDGGCSCRINGRETLVTCEGSYLIYRDSDGVEQRRKIVVAFEMDDCNGVPCVSFTCQDESPLQVIYPAKTENACIEFLIRHYELVREFTRQAPDNILMLAVNSSLMHMGMMARGAEEIEGGCIWSFGGDIRELPRPCQEMITDARKEGLPVLVFGSEKCWSIGIDPDRGVEDVFARDFASD